MCTEILQFEEALKGQLYMNGTLFIIITSLCFIATICIVVALKRPKKGRHIYEHENDSNDRADISDNESDMSIEPILKSELDIMYDVSELIFTAKDGYQLSFVKAPQKITNTTYQEVLSEGSKAVNHAVQCALPALGDVYTVSKLKQMAPNGLFTATVDKAALSHFADGSYTTMVRDSKNHLIANAGYKELKLFSGVNPAVVVGAGMQAMAAISGQYYMTKINSQLDAISKSLDNLKELHHNEKIGTLLNAQKELQEITKRNVVDISDVNEIIRLRNQVGQVYCEYDRRLNDEYEEIKKYSSNHIFVEKRVKEYTRKIEEWNYTLRICAEAEKLRLHSEIAEIGVRMKLDVKDKKLPELFTQLKENVDNSLIKQLRDQSQDILRPILENGEALVGDGKDLLFIDRHKAHQKQIISNVSKSAIEMYATSEEEAFTDKVLEDNNMIPEILMIVDGLGMQRVFVPISQDR